MKKVLNLFFVNEFGDMSQIHIGYRFPLFPIYDIDFDEKSNRTRRIGGIENIVWEYNGKWVKLNSESNIFAYPSVDMNYIIAIYQMCKKFPAPNNALIYNLDGSIHKVLELPELISSRLLTEIEKNNESNPPIEALQFEYGLRFDGFGWCKDKNGNLFNRISIQYHRDYGESRVLKPETGEIGVLVDDWYNYY